MLTYPNPTDPLNGEAASLALKEPEKYKQKIKGMVVKVIFRFLTVQLDYVNKYAKEENIKFKNVRDDDDEMEESLSSASSDSGDLADFEL